MGLIRAGSHKYGSPSLLSERRSESEMGILLVLVPDRHEKGTEKSQRRCRKSGGILSLKTGAEN